MSPDIAASVRTRLVAEAKKRGEDLERTLMRFAAERLLFRLGSSEARHRCLLKGASLLAVWLEDPYRATRDVDILATGQMDDPAVHSLIAGICAVPCPEDGLRFDLSDMVIETIRPGEENAGRRARFRVFLGKARVVLQLDIGVGDAVAIEPQEVTYPTILSSLPAPQIRAYPLVVTVAEKFEAMVKLDIRNSRMKDFHDLWALSGEFEFDGVTLQRAVAACFERRATPWTEEAPRVLTPAFFQIPEIAKRWRDYLAAGAVRVPPPAQFEVIGERIGCFLGPVREAILAGDTFRKNWPSGGPWR
jgi:hypothetical protein